jgi:uncharacterized protein (DUF1810 family)
MNQSTGTAVGRVFIIEKPPAADRSARALGERRRVVADAHVPHDAGDPYNLDRFAQAQKRIYREALSELKQGRKRSHWMWYVFPQFDGLGFSATSQQYPIKSVEEAEAYLNHPVLGLRLIECAEATLRVEGRSAYDIFGSPDDLKLRSCATLFAQVSPAESVFNRLLEKYFHGERDCKTLRLLGVAPILTHDDTSDAYSRTRHRRL